MNVYTMVVLIVAFAMMGSVLKAYYSNRQPRTDDAEAERLRAEVKRLHERLAVLERIATDRENSLEREIEQLRDHR